MVFKVTAKINRDSPESTRITREELGNDQADMSEHSLGSWHLRQRF